jgi:hypothetical protein
MGSATLLTQAQLRGLLGVPASGGFRHLVLCFPVQRGIVLQDQDLQALGEFALPALQTLEASGCLKVTRAGLQALGTLTALKNLNLERCCKIGDAGMQVLGTLTTLQSLELSVVPSSLKGHVTDAGMQALGTLTALNTLKLKASCHVTNAGIQALGALTALQTLELDLTHCDHVGTLSRILGGCRSFSDCAVQALSTLTALQSLDLSPCGEITDRALRELRALPALQSLTLHWCGDGVTEEGLRSLPARVLVVVHPGRTFAHND